MTNIIEPRTLSGFRDFLPDQMAVRKKIIATFTQIFEKYGFQPLETPALEYQDILLGKYGEEAEKLMYLFEDNGQRKVGLKYDLTVPTARVVAQYPNLPKPFKRYQIQPVWRSDKAQKGRYREFTQCDIDTFGTTSPLADAEIIAITQDCLATIGFKKFTIRINSRQVLFKIMDEAGVSPDKVFSAIQSIDKLDKKTWDEVRVELAEKSFPNTVVENIFTKIKMASPDEYLNEVLNILSKFDIDPSSYVFDPTLARGLDYYTGPVFETVVTQNLSTGRQVGSVTGGGRYDKLIGSFIGRDVPAVGNSFGLDRIVDVITELNLWPDIQISQTKVLVTVFTPTLLDRSLEIAGKLREAKINTELYLDTAAKLDKQLKYADQKGIPFVIIVGPDEAAKNLVTLKNFKKKSQVTKPLPDVIKLMDEAV